MNTAHCLERTPSSRRSAIASHLQAARKPADTTPPARCRSRQCARATAPPAGKALPGRAAGGSPPVPSSGSRCACLQQPAPGRAAQSLGRRGLAASSDAAASGDAALASGSISAPLTEPQQEKVDQRSSNCQLHGGEAHGREGLAAAATAGHEHTSARARAPSAVSSRVLWQLPRTSEGAWTTERTTSREVSTGRQ